MEKEGKCLEKMVCNYKSDLAKIEKRIAELRTMIKSKGVNCGTLNRRLAVLIDERNGLNMSIAMMTDYINQVKLRSMEVG